MLDDLASAPDPYPAYAELRRRGVHRADDGRWVVARAADVRTALEAPELAVVSPSTGICDLDEAAAMMARFSDGRDHECRRRIALDALVSVDPSRLRRSVGVRSAEVLASTPSTDLTAMTRHAVAVVLAAELGFGDPAGCADAIVLLASVLAPVAGSVRAPEGAVESALDSLRAAAPSSERLAATNQLALLFQALDATAGLVTNTVLAMASGDGASAANIDSAALVAETARWDPAAQNTRRIARSPLRLAGERIDERDVIVVVLAAANRDAALVDRPDMFDPRRPSASAPDGFGVGFGAGTHACPGERIALAVAAGVVDAVRASGRRVATGDVCYERRPNLRIAASLTVQ